MREYGKIAPTFWTGETGQLLREHGRSVQVLATYLITAPTSSALGLYYLPLEYASFETGISPPEVFQLMDFLTHIQFSTYDDVPHWVFVTEMARFQIGDKLKPADKRVPWIQRELNRCPSDRLRSLFLGRYLNDFHLSSSRASRKKRVLTEGPSKTLRSQEQEQEQEQDLRLIHDSSIIEGVPKKNGATPPLTAPPRQKATPEPERCPSFGEFGYARLSARELGELQTRLGERCMDYIARFDGWVAEAPNAKAHGISRRDRHCYPTILNWHRRDLAEGKLKNGRQETKGELLVRRQREEGEKLRQLLSGSVGSWPGPGGSS